MLVYPDHRNTLINIVSIDPGTTNLGISNICIDMDTMKIVSTEASTFNSNKMLTYDELLLETHSERMCKIMAQKDNLIKLFNYYTPSYICCESPFFNKKFPGAYGPLMEILTIIKVACIEYSPLIEFILYPPGIIKKSLNVNQVGKDPVRECILKYEGLKFTGVFSLDMLDEHALDAIAVGLCHYTKMKEEYLKCH